MIGAARASVGAGLVLLLVACGGSDDTLVDAEHALAEALADDLDVAADAVAVACPHGADLREGSELSCAVAIGGAAGQEVPVTIGSGGRAMLTVAVIPTQAAEAHVADVLHLGLTAQVSCGDTTLLVGPVGATFRCEVVEGDRPGRAYELEVTSLDGDVRYRAVPFGVAAG